MPKLNSKKIQKLRLSSIDKNGSFLSASSLSKLLNISDRVIYRMENEEDYNPGVFTIYKVSEYFNVSIDDLIVKD